MSILIEPSGDSRPGTASESSIILKTEVDTDLRGDRIGGAAGRLDSFLLNALWDPQARPLLLRYEACFTSFLQSSAPGSI